MNKIQELMQQEVSRKDFIKYIGLAFLSLIGVSAMLQNLSKTLGQNVNQKATSGYGRSPYGR